MVLFYDTIQGLGGCLRQAFPVLAPWIQPNITHLLRQLISFAEHSIYGQELKPALSNWNSIFFSLSVRCSYWSGTIKYAGCPWTLTNEGKVRRLYKWIWFRYQYFNFTL